MNLRAKLTLLVLLSVLLPLLSVGIVVYFAQKASMEEILDSQLRATGAGTIKRLDEFIGEHIPLLEVVSGSSTLRSGDVATAEYGLGRYLASFPDFDALIFTDTRNRVFAHTGAPLLTQGEGSLEQAAAGWLKEAKAGAGIIDRVTPQKGDMPRYLVYAAPVLHDGVHYGWVFGQMDGEKIAAITNAVRIGETGRSTLFNRNGILIGHPLKERYGDDMSRYPILRKPVEHAIGDPGGFFVSRDGREKWGMTLMLDPAFGLGWGIIVDQTKAELYAPITTLGNTFILGAAIGSLLFSLAGFWFARRLTTPLATIQNGMMDFFRFLKRETDQAPRIKITTRDEFHQMADAINDNIGVVENEITRSRELEQARQEAFERLDKIARQVPGMVYQFRMRPDESTSIPYSSNDILGLFGLAPQDVVDDAGKIFERIHPNDRARVVESIRESARELAPWSCEFRVARDNEGERWLSGASRPQREADGSTLWHGFVSDVTERKQQEVLLQHLNDQLEAEVAERTLDLTQANLALVSREEEIRSIVEYMVDCVITIDEHGIVRSANQVVEALFGYDRDEVIGNNISMLMPEPHRSAHDGYLEHFCRTGEAHIIDRKREIEGLHKNGSLIPLELAVNQYFVGGQRFFTGIMRDIREHLRVMHALEQSRADAEAANLAKSAFLAAMSHEIRTPMNGVIGMIDVLHQSSLKESQMEMVDIIRDSAFSLLSIIDDILDFSKIEAGKFQLDPAPTSIPALVEGVASTLDKVAARNGIEFTLFVDPAISGLAVCDAGRLRQVLVNLAGNAIKFSAGLKRRGKVSLRVLLSAQAGEQMTLEFRVTDNGIGMDEATLVRLFAPFVQADVSTTRRYGGTGLGLTISRHLLQMMGGDISVQSAPDLGSTFTVSLSLARSPDVVSDTSPDMAGWVAGLECMVAGGTGTLADDLAAYLTHAGARVEQASDLAGVERWIAQRPPGLAIAIIDTAGAKLPLDEVRAAARTRAEYASVEYETRFVVIERGARRWCRAEANDLVKLDGDAMPRRMFLEAVALAAGRIKEKHDSVPDPAAAPLPLSREEALRHGKLILVAEDNETNQKVIRHQLALLGFVADIANDGIEALESVKRDAYALLLTDLHMPEMDGYQLTAAIRAGETSGKRLPIVAITANALKGEALHCLALGMDDYLSKPVQIAQLRDVLEKWLNTKAPKTGQTKPPSHTLAAPVNSTVPVDVNVLKALVGDDESVIDEFLEDFRSSTAKIAAELKAACAAGNALAAGALAHKLKSSARAVGAMKLGELCAEMEYEGKGGELEILLKLLPAFEMEMAAVEHYLDSL